MLFCLHYPTNISLGGLFACHAAWQRSEVIGCAACESSSFWWPLNASVPINEFHFIDTLSDPQFSSTRYPQKILIDVGGEEGTDDSFK